MKKYICIDVGGTSIKYGVISEQGNIITQNKVDTEAKKGGNTVINKIKDIVFGYINNYELQNIQGVCVSTAGMVDPKEGKILYASELIPDYTGTEIKKEIEQEFKLHCEVENDVNCAGLGEMWLGAGKESTSSICMTIGTGIGGCVIIDNKLLHGFTNSAGELGYMKVEGNDIQDVAATSALVDKVRKIKNDDSIDGVKVFELAKSGDKECIDAIDNLVEKLSIAIANAVYILNPQVVILGGGIIAQEDYLYHRICNAVKRNLLPHIYENTQIKFAKNQNNAGMLGALYNFIQKHN